MTDFFDTVDEIRARYSEQLQQSFLFQSGR